MRTQCPGERSCVCLALLAYASIVASPCITKAALARRLSLVSVCPLCCRVKSVTMLRAIGGPSEPSDERARLPMHCTSISFCSPQL